MTATARAAVEKEEAVAKLAEYLKPGDRVYTILRHVSKSGMMRSISVVIMRDGEPWDVTYWVSMILGYRVDQSTGGLRVSGCGMDMGFSVVNSLQGVLHSIYGKDDGTGTREPFHLRHSWL